MNTKTVILLTLIFSVAAGALIFWGVRTDAALGADPAVASAASAPLIHPTDLQKFFHGILGLLAYIAVIFLYCVPTLIAFQRHHRQRVAIRILNLLLGWTVLGWVAAAVWAYTSDVE
jgi:ABC-type uncharacterized transport system permease subunit